MKAQRGVVSTSGLAHGKAQFPKRGSLHLGRCRTTKQPSCWGAAMALYVNSTSFFILAIPIVIKKMALP